MQVYGENLKTLVKKMVEVNDDCMYDEDDNYSDLYIYDCCKCLKDNANIDGINRDEIINELMESLELELESADLWDYCKRYCNCIYGNLLPMIYNIAEMEGEDYPFEIDYDDKELPVLRHKIAVDSNYSSDEEVTFLDCVDALTHNKAYKDFVTPTILQETITDLERWQSAHYLWRDYMESISYKDKLDMLIAITGAVRI